MKKFFLTFSNSNLENQYQTSLDVERIARFIHFIELELFLSFIFGLITLISKFSIYLLIFVIICPFILISIFIIKKYLLKYLFYYLFILNSCFLIFFIDLISVYKNDFPDMSLSLMMPFNLFLYMSLISRLKWLNSLMFYILVMIIFACRCLDLSMWQNKGQNIGILFCFFGFGVMVYSQEKSSRDSFIKIEESHKHLNQFKILLQKGLPSPIFIIDYKNQKMEVCNNEALKLFKKIGVKNNQKTLFDLFEIFLENLKMSTINETNNIKNFLKSYYENSEINNSFEEVDFLSLNVSSNCNMLRSTAFSLEEENNNDKKYYEIKIAKILWENQICLFVLMNDNTNTRKITELKHLDDYKNRILATISHDLRTPLNWISGSIEISLPLLKNKEIEENLKIALCSANLLNFMINDILDFSSISFKNIVLSFSKINLSLLIEKTIEMIRFQAQNKKLEVKVNLKISNDLTLISDFIRLQQILLNLLSNAIKFTIKGEIELEVEQINSYFKFMVRDSGVGIEEKQKNNILNLFNTKSDMYSLTSIGLGLTVSQTLVKLLFEGPTTDSGIHIDSEFGKGSTFWFYVNNDAEKKYKSNEEIFNFSEKFPFNSLNRMSEDILNRNSDENLNIYDDSHHKLEKRHSISYKGSFFELTPVAKRTKKKILVVDDDPMNLLIIKKYIEYFNFECITAINGKIAYEIFEENLKNNEDFTAVLMDCNMPVLDGFQSTEKIIDLLNFNHKEIVPVIAITANVTFEDRKKCEKAGMIKVLTKPIRRNELKECLELVLGLKLDK